MSLWRNLVSELRIFSVYNVILQSLYEAKILGPWSSAYTSKAFIEDQVETSNWQVIDHVWTTGGIMAPESIKSFALRQRCSWTEVALITSVWKLKGIHCNGEVTSHKDVSYQTSREYIERSAEFFDPVPTSHLTISRTSRGYILRYWTTCACRAARWGNRDCCQGLWHWHRHQRWRRLPYRQRESHFISGARKDRQILASHYNTNNY